MIYLALLGFIGMALVAGGTIVMIRSINTLKNINREYRRELRRSDDIIRDLTDEYEVLLDKMYFKKDPSDIKFGEF
ncbi:MAG: hypothetical protein IIY21_02230 [Clostridiales bacterium]|nr:hypothetical protein [Clostridiales bacterium]